MPVDQTNRPTAATTIRLFSVVRQALAGSIGLLLYRRATTDLGGGGVEVTRSITVASSAAGGARSSPRGRGAPTGGGARALRGCRCGGEWSCTSAPTALRLLAMRVRAVAHAR